MLNLEKNSKIVFSLMGFLENLLNLIFCISKNLIKLQIKFNNRNLII